MSFSGIPAEAFDFYEALQADNSRTFWLANKHTYESFVRDPMAALGAELEPEFGGWHLYRPYRDVRFSADKTPYKDHQGLFVESRNGLGWYVQISVQGLMAGGGWHLATPGQIANYRRAVEADARGALQGLLDGAAQEGLATSGERLKTRPRGIAADHPRVELLRYRSLHLSRTWVPQPWMGTPEAAERVRLAWRAMVPTLKWLAEAVGPGEPPTRSRRG